MSAGPIEQAKEKLGITALWKLRNWPREPGKECHCPFRPEDSRATFSVFTTDKGVELAKDFKSGDIYDAPALLAAVEGLSKRDACKLFIELAGVRGEPTRHAGRQTHRRPSVPVKTAPERCKPSLPPLRAPNAEEIATIAKQRHVSEESVAFAAGIGVLFVSRYRGFPCWAITDDERWNCQFRRLDGRPFPHPAGSKKTLCVSGSWASWPIGAANLGTATRGLLVEGSGDFLAALHFIVAENAQDHCAAISMTGAANWIPAVVLARLAKLRVRIFPHLDTSRAGEEAALRWETQLSAAGADEPHCFDLSDLQTVAGESVTDLNDVLKMDPPAILDLGAIATF